MRRWGAWKAFDFLFKSNLVHLVFSPYEEDATQTQPTAKAAQRKVMLQPIAPPSMVCSGKFSLDIDISSSEWDGDLFKFALKISVFGGLGHQ